MITVTPSNRQIRIPIVPAEHGVVATVRLTSGTDIPESSIARVRSLSPVGEQYLDFQPTTAEGPYLEDGDTSDAESTDRRRA